MSWRRVLVLGLADGACLAAFIAAIASLVVGRWILGALLAGLAVCLIGIASRARETQ